MFVKFGEAFFNVAHIVYVKAYEMQSNERIGYYLEMSTIHPEFNIRYETFDTTQKISFLNRKKELFEALKIL